MAITNVPTPTLTDTGFAAPDEADILSGAFADLQASFGGALNPSLSTPQGQLATSNAAIMAAVNALFLLIVNQIDPAYSSGRMQDGIGRLYFIYRKPPVATVVNVTVIGASQTLIPTGALAVATNGAIYQSTASITIGTGGTATGTFANIATGPIPCPAGTLNRIYRAIPGWDAITNPADGALGRDVESRVDFEARRSASVAANALGILPAVRGAVLSVEGVLDAYVTENNTGAPVTTGGVTLPAHSLYIAAQGGTDGAVAQAIWTKKSPGCDYYGNTTITVEDQTSGYVPPYPTYAVTFQRPSSLPIYFAVTIALSSAVPASAADQIKAAIVASFNGEDGGSRVHIGTTVYASRYFANVAALGPWCQIISLHVGTSSVPTGDSVPVQIDQYPSISTDNIAVTIT